MSIAHCTHRQTGPYPQVIAKVAHFLRRAAPTGRVAMLWTQNFIVIR